MNAIAHKSRLGIVAALGLALWASSVRADEPRSYYSDWHKHPQRSYHYAYYFYKPSAQDPEYRTHVCVQRLSQPQYVYYYNPYDKLYWGRYDLERQGYSALEPEDRRGRLAEIPASAFPAPGEMPSMPEATDGQSMPRPTNMPLAAN